MDEFYSKRKKVCSRGHEKNPENTGNDGSCKICRAALQRQRRKDNPEKTKLRAREHYAANKDKIRATHKNWSKKNPELVIKHNKHRHTRAKELLTDSYVTKILGTTVGNADDNCLYLIQLKRAHLLLKRGIKNEKRKTAC